MPSLWSMSPGTSGEVSERSTAASGTGTTLSLGGRQGPKRVAACVAIALAASSAFLLTVAALFSLEVARSDGGSPPGEYAITVAAYVVELAPVLLCAYCGIRFLQGRERMGRRTLAAAAVAIAIPTIAKLISLLT